MMLEFECAEDGTIEALYNSALWFSSCIESKKRMEGAEDPRAKAGLVVCLPSRSAWPTS